MIDISKQIAYWRDGALDDWEVARELVRNGRTRHGLFFAHLALEKLIKAHVCLHTQDLPPRIHNLIRLAEMSALVFDQDQRDIMAEMNAFTIEGRYPDVFISPLPQDEAEHYLNHVEKVFKWLMNPLKK